MVSINLLKIDTKHARFEDPQSSPNLKKVRPAPSVWKFVSLEHRGKSCVWDERPGVYMLEWRDGPQRKRETAGRAPAEALAALQRKRLELAGAAVLACDVKPEPPPALTSGTPLRVAVESYLDHVRVHSPGKPGTLARYRAVMDPFLRLMKHRRALEAAVRETAGKGRRSQRVFHGS